MCAEKLRQQHNKEIEEKDIEMEEIRAATSKRLKALEAQVEEEYVQRQDALKERRDLERKLHTLREQAPDHDLGIELLCFFIIPHQFT